MRGLPLLFAIIVGSVAYAAGPTPFSGPRYVNRAQSVEICGLHADSVDHVADVLVDRGGVREAAGDEKFLAYESLDRTHIWTFTRAGHPAHPVVICRELTDGAAGLELSMQVVCGGDRPSCAALYVEFLGLNAQIKASARKPS